MTGQSAELLAVMRELLQAIPGRRGIPPVAAGHVWRAHTRGLGLKESRCWVVQPHKVTYLITMPRCTCRYPWPTRRPLGEHLMDAVLQDFEAEAQVDVSALHCLALGDADAGIFCCQGLAQHVDISLQRGMRWHRKKQAQQQVTVCQHSGLKRHRVGGCIVRISSACCTQAAPYRLLGG